MLASRKVQTHNHHDLERDPSDPGVERLPRPRLDATEISETRVFNVTEGQLDTESVLATLDADTCNSIARPAGHGMFTRIETLRYLAS